MAPAFHCSCHWRPTQSLLLFPGGYTVPRGQDVMISVYNIHHSPAVWDEAEAFQHERFSLDSRTPNEQNTDYRSVMQASVLLIHGRLACFRHCLCRTLTQQGIVLWCKMEMALAGLMHLSWTQATALQQSRACKMYTAKLKCAQELLCWCQQT